MSNFDTTRAHGLWHHTEAVSSPQIRQDLSDACYQPFRSESSLQVCSPTANIYPTRISQLPRPWDCNNVLAEVSSPHVLDYMVSRLSNLDTKGGTRGV